MTRHFFAARKFFAILVAMAVFLFAQNEVLAAPPAYRASGTFTSGAAAITVPYPASMLANDVCLLAVESENQAIALTTANGFVQVPTWSPQFAGTAAVNPASRLALFWKRTVGGDAAPVVTDAGDHTTGRIHCFSGVITSGDPWDTGAGGNDGAVNDTTGTIPGATTTLTDTLVVLLTSNSRDANSTANCSAWTNASLTSLTEWSDNTSNTGLGGGHCMATGLKAVAGAYATTTVTLAATSFKGAISLALKPAPTTTTLATGTDPAAATIAPGATVTDVDLFTLQTSSGTEAITSVTVNLSMISGVGRLAITNNADAELGFTTTPVAGSNTITVAGMSATTALTTFKVRVTPLSHALMPAVPGAAYAITAPVTAWVGPYTHAGSDTNPNALTIDNESPAGATATSGTAGNANVTLNWTTSISADFNTTSGSVIYRWTTTAGAEVPVEGSTAVAGTSNGTAFVACVITSAASTPLTAINGTGGSAGCSTTALTNGTAYVYKIFQKDIRGNYDTGVTIGTFTPAALPTATTTAASGITTPNNGTSWSATLNGIVSSNGTSTVVSFEYGLTTAYGTSVPATQSPLAVDAVNTAVSAGLIGLNCNTTFHYRVVATNTAGTTNGLDSTFTTGSCPGAPFAATDCAATRFGGDLGCTANDVHITNITLAPTGQQSSCVSGAPVTLDLDMTVNFASPARWDVGIFIANDGKLPSLLPANGGASSCSVDILPITPPTYGYTFPDLDGAPMGTLDTCGDGNGSIDDSLLPGGTVPLGDGVKRMTGVIIPCYATSDSGGKLFVPFVVSWDNQKSPIGSLCTSNQYPVPNTTSKCNAPLSSAPIEVVVLPKINKTHSGASFNPPTAPITYTIAVFNDSGGTLQASFFKDPVVTGLAVTGLSCTPANGATCPIANNTVADMQGPTGIPIPSANLPNNSSLIFTVTGTLSGSIGTTIDNTATVSIGLNTNSSTDSVMLGTASGSKSFSPAAITEGNNSLMTITFTNPTASAVTGVSFLDTYPADLVNAASPGGSTTCGGTPVATAGGNTLAFSGGTIPANGSCTVTVYVTSATANSYINSVSFTPGSLGSASATLSVTAPISGGFNACDVGTPCSTSGIITTKIAGVAFRLDLVELGINQNYNKTVTVELLDSSNPGGFDPGTGCPNNIVSIPTVVTPIPSPTFVNSKISTALITVANVYRNVRVRVTGTGPSIVGCSTNNFAIRPSYLDLAVTDLDWETAYTGTGAARALDTTIVHKAGRPFTIQATAYNGSLSITSNYAGTPTSSAIAYITPASCTSNTCTLALGTFVDGTASDGMVRSTTATYTEVGTFDVQVIDTSFAEDDSGDTAGDCVNTSDLNGNAHSRYVCSALKPVGRFVPDHFDLSDGAIVNRSDINAGTGCSPTPSTFTYMGEPMMASFKLTARNFGGNTTQNYAGSFANTISTWTTDTGSDRLGLWMIGQNYAVSPGTCTVLFSNATPSVTSYACTGVSNPTPINRTAGPRVTISSSPAAPSMSWASGVGTFSAHTVLERADSPDGPYNTLNIGVAPVDADGVALSAYDLDADNSGTPERASLGTTDVRFGRLWLGNAYGSDKRNLDILFEYQYWNNSVFVKNTYDSCTILGNGNIALGNQQGGLAGYAEVITVSATVNGAGTITLPKPPSAAAGSVDLVVNLGSSGSPSNCPSLPYGTSTSAALSYLSGKWCGSNYDRDPTARATFGIYGGNKGPIYIRESY